MAASPDVPVDPVGFFFQHFPKPRLKDIARSVVNGYSEAVARCREFAYPEMHDLLPIERRAIIEQSIEFIVQRYRTMKAEPRHNAAKNHHHRLIECGQILMSVHMIRTRNEMVRDAVCRQELVIREQMGLWEEPIAPPPNARLVAFLTHVVPDSWKEEHQNLGPVYLDVRFPNEECDSYLEAFIDCYEMFPDLRRRPGDEGGEGHRINVPRVPIRPVAEAGDQ